MGKSRSTYRGEEKYNGRGFIVGWWEKPERKRLL